jgi:hypothetical protein
MKIHPTKNTNTNIVDSQTFLMGPHLVSNNSEMEIRSSRTKAIT